MKRSKLEIKKQFGRPSKKMSEQACERQQAGTACEREQTERRPKQLSFIRKLKDVFIGPRRGTHAKANRPLDSKKPIHVCFRSKFAKGKRSMLGINKLKVKQLVDSLSERFGITIVKYANVGNHLHLVIRLSGSTMTSRRLYRKWIRLLTSRLAFEIGGSKKGQPFLDENGERTKFWDSIPFTRVIHGLRGWKVIDRYVFKNELESQGVPSSLAIKIAAEFHDTSRIQELPNWKSSA